MKKQFIETMKFDGPWALLFFSVIALMLTFMSCGPCSTDIKKTYVTKTVILEIHKATGTYTMEACTRVPPNGQPDTHDYSFHINSEKTLYGFWGDAIDVNVLSCRTLGVAGETNQDADPKQAEPTTHYSIYHIDLPTDYANISKDPERPTMLNSYIKNDTLFIRFR